MRLRMAILLSLVLAVMGCTGGRPAGHSPSPAAIVVGLINTEDAAVGSFPDLRRGAIVAEKYVNDTVNGVNGRPLRLDVCLTTGTPESSQACANHLLARHPVAVIGGVDLGAAASLPPLQSAGVPYIGGTPAATDALTSSGSYMLAGGTATEILGEVGYATAVLHVTRMAVVYADVPGLLSTAASLLKRIARKAGVTHVDLLPVEATAPDVTPALSAAGAGKPQAVIAVFPSQACVQVVQAVVALGLKTRMMYPSFCAVDSVFAAAGSSIDGSVFATGYTPYVQSSDIDVQTYLAAIHKYDASLRPSLLSQAGFSDVMVVSRLIAALGPNPSVATLTTELKATRHHVGFMSHQFSCDGKQIPLLRSLCNPFVQISVVSGGRLQPVGGWADTAPTAKLALP